ncbi:hypothetical protein SAMN05421796_10264 [Chryseobacterium piscicola]|jgi:hypothetical protein|uniref:Uncharacterized protein n=1 Tax=Chryseobacterium piscicola TaxID=551459 RepID=A0A1N7L6X6_9FLAO|nr:hypothetical protein [Chryseobacterium piscicola]PQA97398.1 hypothetical protein B0A70_01655 [Chryseobacterium piscicola]SIS69430.1 hypothetical protein SAMN05421796_10264 [Chryseobacterium piscicola]
MRILLTFSILLSTIYARAQVAIGKTTISNNSVSLEFGNNESRGVILPWVTNVTTMTNAVNGTMAYDVATLKLKVKLATGWKDLSVDTSGKTTDPVSGVNGITIQNAAKEAADAKVSIGTPTSTPGILVLEDSNKAMVLPKVSNPQTAIINPSPGMMVYDTNTKSLAVFNGTVWSFWKA